MILVVAVLVMLVILGTAYVSMSRQDRTAGRAAAGAGNADAAMDSTVKYIGQTIAKSWTDYLSGTAGSTYEDYPGTQRPWLANIEPWDNTGANGTWNAWQQISLVGASSPASLDDYIDADSLLPLVNTDFVSGTAKDQLLPLSTLANGYTNKLADADADGYADSRWIKLPLPTTDGVTWIAAIRIIDESGLINVNTATEIEEAAAGAKVLGATPADVNLKRFLGSAVMTSFNAQGTKLDGVTAWPTISAASVATLIGYDTSTGASIGNSGAMMLLYQTLGLNSQGFPVVAGAYPNYTVPLTDTDRMLAWTKLGSELTAPTGGVTPLGMSDLLQLRRKFGTNTGSWSKLESVLDANSDGVLRANRLETNSNAPTGTSFPLSVQQFMADRRHLLTTYNGARPLRPRWASGVSGAAIDITATGDRKLNPNTATGADCASVLAAVLKQDVAAPYGGSTDAAEDAAAALAANLLAYRSPGAFDPTPSKVVYTRTSDSKTITCFGLERQPFFKEVSTVIVYEDRTNGVGAGSPTDMQNDVGGDDDKTIQFNATGAQTERLGQYFLVELGNPWKASPSEDIDLTNFYLRVNGDNNNLIRLSGAIPAGNGQFIIYTTNGTAGFTPARNADTDMANMVSAITTHNQSVDPSTYTAWTFTPGGALTIELVYDAGASGPPYVASSNYVVVDKITATAAQDLTANQALSAEGKRYVVSRSLQRDDKPPTGGGFPKYIYEDAATIDQTITLDAEQPGDGAAFLPTITGMSADNTVPNADLPTAVSPFQFIVRNGNLDTVGEMGLLLTVANKFDGTTWTTISEQLAANRAKIYNGRLNLYVNPRTTAPEIPVAATFFDQFAILNGSATNNQMVYGLININTAPLSVLKMLPYMQGFSGNIATEAAPFVATGIQHYRDSLAISGGPDFLARVATTGVTGLRTANGFAATGESMMVRESPLTPPAFPDYDIDGLAYDGNDADGTKGDYLNPGGGLSDTVVDDLEEQQLRFNRISNLITVRSDVFTAYVLLQGRKMNSGGTYDVVAQRRFIVTYDRSNVDGSGGAGKTSPQVVMFAEDK